MSAWSRVGARAAVVVTLALAISPLPQAQARPTYPSQEQVDSARSVARSKAAQAADLQRQLAAVMDRLARLEVAADVAVEGFNEARLELEQAQAAAAAARDRARAAAAEADSARRALGQIAAAAYRSGGVLASVGLVLDAEGPAQVFDEIGALRIAANSQSTVYLRWQAAKSKADAARQSADHAVRAQERAARRAEEARDAASAAVSQQQRQVAAAQRERDQVTAALAEANQTTVELERQRQAGLQAEAERKAREEAERKAREEAERKARDEAERKAREAAERKAREEAERRASAEAAPSKSSSSTADPEPSRTDPAPSSSGSSGVPYDASAAKKVIAFARAQLGEPYVWGAAGPDAWDCSGLTMMAWRQAGVRLTHGARAQFRETRQISYGQLRPGDLVFHANGSTPSTIFHVGIYIGDGKMIHAPNSSRPVEIKSIFYMGAPGFYSRPMT